MIIAKSELERLINTDYNKIKRAVYSRAFAFYIDPDDLLSAVHYKLSMAIHNNAFDYDRIERFWAFIYAVINNCAIDHKRRNAVHFEDISEIHERVLGSTQPSYEQKDFSKVLCKELYARLSKKERIIFKPFFLDGANYQEVADETGFGMQIVKNLIFNVRKKANLIFSNDYKSLFN